MEGHRRTRSAASWRAPLAHSTSARAASGPAVSVAAAPVPGRVARACEELSRQGQRVRRRGQWDLVMRTRPPVRSAPVATTHRPRPRWPTGWRRVAPGPAAVRLSPGPRTWTRTGSSVAAAILPWARTLLVRRGRAPLPVLWLIPALAAVRGGRVSSRPRAGDPGTPSTRCVRAQRRQRVLSVERDPRRPPRRRRVPARIAGVFRSVRGQCTSTGRRWPARCGGPLRRSTAVFAAAIEARARSTTWPPTPCWTYGGTQRHGRGGPADRPDRPAQIVLPPVAVGALLAKGERFGLIQVRSPVRDRLPARGRRDRARRAGRPRPRRAEGERARDRHRPLEPRQTLGHASRARLAWRRAPMHGASSQPHSMVTAGDTVSMTPEFTVWSARRGTAPGKTYTGILAPPRSWPYRRGF
jgi:hypothetical protein